MAREPLPLYLTHRPVIAMEYETHDGPYAPSGSDAQYITGGFSTWDEAELSVKVFRHTGTKWSRESEELPLWRPIDLVILEVLMMEQIGNPPITVSPGMFHQQPTEIALPFRGSPVDLYAVQQQLANPLLLERLDVLHRLLDRFRGHKTAHDGTPAPSAAPGAERPIGHKSVTINGTTIDVPIYQSDVEAGLA